MSSLLPSWWFRRKDYEGSIAAKRGGVFSGAGAQKLLGFAFDRGAMMAKQLPYERLDQLTMEVIYGVR